MGLTLVREDRVGRTSSVSVVAPAAAPSSYVRKGETLKASKREANLKIKFPQGASPLKAPCRPRGNRPGVEAQQCVKLTDTNQP